MSPERRPWRWGLGTALLLSGPLQGAPMTRPLATSGDWVATETITQGTPGGKTCQALDPTVGMAFRADAAGIALLVGNRHWDLPAAWHGTIRIMLGPATLSLPVTANTSNTVAAILASVELKALFGEMARAPAMRVVVGKTTPLDTPLKVSLAGSTAVLRAFQTCAGIG